MRETRKNEEMLNVWKRGNGNYCTQLKWFFFCSVGADFFFLNLIVSTTTMCVINSSS